ncbi:D-alanine--D-alanine ligase-like [Bradysia coprophila]|uniref:D-alanine--D-alanine ligase-like n=1 Tax=Bradysia coprophila TaxID=38358 RepID=UPI00187DA541|nr:D-alanine--D-alanine ligase-like [Bradysia coprophila]
MKICVLLSSYGGVGSSFEHYELYQNPGLYDKKHVYEQRIIAKNNAKEEIDRILQEGFDLIWHFLWGPVNEDIAGVNEIKYLETKNVSMIGTSSKFLSLTKLDYKEAMASANIKTPKGIVVKGDDESLAHLELGHLTFPLIVKPSVGCGSEHMTEDSVCHNVVALEQQVKLLKSKINVNYEILIEEFVEGDEVAVVILETKNGVVALHPTIFVFPEDWPPTKKFLDFDAKFVGIERGDIIHKLFDGNTEMKEKIEETAIKAYEELGVLGSGYARVDFRVKGSEVYVLEINPCPAFFAELGNRSGDDFVIESTFPGGHENLIETIISSKRRFDAILKEYNGVTASNYDAAIEVKGKNLFAIWECLTDTFDYGGTVLDLGCGTGLVGKIIKKKYDAKLTGIDLSPEMAKLIDNYEELHLGYMENVVVELKARSFNHIVSAGALAFIDQKSFVNLFVRLFFLATDSLTLIIDEMSDEFRTDCAVKYNVMLFNHADTVNNYSIPKGWNLVYSKRALLWTSPRIGTDIYGLVFRYERCTRV